MRGAVEAESAGFRPLLTFPDRDAVYRSPELFPLFANRVMARARPEYDGFVRWLDLPPGETDPLLLLARSEGQRETDMFEVFSAPERTPDARYRMTFFVHGLRHRTEKALAVALELEPGERLHLQPDPGNPEDQEALKVIGRGEHVGFVPRYLLRDLHSLRLAGADDTMVAVTRVNPPPAPLQFRVLTSFDAPWPEGFRPFAGPEFLPLRTDLPAVA